MNQNSKAIWTEGIRAGVISTVFFAIGVLLLALFAKLFSLDGTVLNICNQVLKVIALSLGLLLTVKYDNFLKKSLIGGSVFYLLSILIFGLFGGKFTFGFALLELFIALLIALIISVIKSRRA